MTSTPTTSLADRRGTALVIGGSGSIGGATALALARAGSDVAVSYRSNRKAADDTVDAIRTLGGRAASYRSATDDDRRVDAMVGLVDADFGGIHTVVTAAAPIARQHWTSQIEPDELDAMLSQDVTAFHRVARAALPPLRESGGSIVAITTVANRRHVARDALSSAPKAAVEALVRALAAEEGRHGVRANAVGVGILRDGMSLRLLEQGDVRDKDLDHARAMVPLGRLGSAKEIAHVVAFLASDAAAYITGQWIDVDGGYAL